MSKINALRFVNINYNNNMSKISDECLHLNGENTLLSMDNGVGKTVMVQLITALFVQKRYHDVKGRPFAGYFHSSKPSFIMAEWALDGGSGFVLTGMMVRQNQHLEDGANPLEMVNFVAEYKSQCQYDIHHIGIMEKNQKEIILKSYGSCKQLFEGLKRESGGSFLYYDMNNSSQARQYFQKLREYGIDFREWQSIIREVNKDESGLSDLFEECKNERALVEKWFLKVIHDKLNHRKDRIKEFCDLMERYIKSYHDNAISIQRKENIEYLQQRSQEISTAAEKLKSAEEQEMQQLLQLQGFYKEMERLRAETSDSLSETDSVLERLYQDLQRLEQERLSAEYHLRHDEYEKHAQLEMELAEKLQQIKEQLIHWQRKKHIQECAYQQKLIDDDISAICFYEQKRDEENRKNEDKRPEIEYIGFRLKQYYQDLMKKREEEAAELEASISEAANELIRLKGIEDDCQKEYRSLSQSRGRLEADRNSYNKIEANYNKKYKGNLHRNLLGVYEDMVLGTLEQAINQRVSENKAILLAARKRLLAVEENQKAKERELQAVQEMKQKNKYEIQLTEQQQEASKKKLEERKRILEYAGLPEEELFSYQLIVKKLQEKIGQSQAEIKRVTMEEAALKKEFSVLESGRNIELSEEFLDLMNRNDINAVQGLEWLKKNNQDNEANKALVGRLPFLPYSLIMSSAELQRLRAAAQQVHTSFPIPIVLREELSQNDEKSQDIDYQKLHFFMLFNNDLLEESKVEELKRTIQHRMIMKAEELSRRHEENKLYVELSQALQQQSDITRESVLAIKNRLLELEQVASDLQQQMAEVLHSIEAAKESKGSLEKEITQCERHDIALSYQAEDFQGLRLAYISYKKQLQELQDCLEAMEACEKKLQQTRSKQQSCQSQQQLYMESLSKIKQLIEAQGQASAVYQGYRQAPCPASLEDVADDFRILESKYKAMVEDFKGNIIELEKQINTLRDRSGKAQEHLNDMASSYELEQVDWNQLEYSRTEERLAEKKIEDMEREREESQQDERKAHTDAALVKHKMDTIAEKLRREFELQSPLDKSMIRPRDYAAEREALVCERRTQEELGKKLRERINIYDSILVAAIDYKSEAEISLMEWPDFSLYAREELRDYYGNMRHHYQSYQKDGSRRRLKLKEIIDHILRDVQLSDVFFQRQLGTLAGTSDHGDSALKQLGIIMEVYSNIMKKLLLDLAKVEQEKSNVVDLLLEYISNVHEEMGKLDKNSAINIRGRSIKMLRLELPVWSTHQEIYQGMMQEMVDELTASGMELMGQGTSAKALIAQEITTKNLYDTVIGIHNIGIHLYKIERDRETQITWREVAKNSGGEGFLSAFVILSSLLYYMRRDDADVFADRNEGKVLLLDNPFAKTYSAHLLQPMMEVARKNNTQLICLTGLGGDAIYDRFNNIYILRLINSSLSNVRYLSGRHVNGNEPQIMATDRFFVTDAFEEVPLF